MHKKSANRGTYSLLPLVGALLLAGVLGYVIGRTVAVRTVVSLSSTEVIEETSIPEPTVVLEGVQNGKVVGSMKGEVRMWVGEKQVIPNEEGHFAVDPGPLLVNTINILVPDGMRFVASSRGKKFYPVLASEAHRIVPENRVYFEQAEEAEKAGYSR